MNQLPYSSLFFTYKLNTRADTHTYVVLYDMYKRDTNKARILGSPLSEVRRTGTYVRYECYKEKSTAACLRMRRGGKLNVYMIARPIIE